MCSLFAGRNGASNTISSSRYFYAKSELHLIVQDFNKDITRTYKKLKEKHMRERKRLMFLIKQENKKYLKGLTMRDFLTPRAQPIRFDENILKIEKLEMFNIKKPC